MDMTSDKSHAEKGINISFLKPVLLKYKVLKITK